MENFRTYEHLGFLGDENCFVICVNLVKRGGNEFVSGLGATSRHREFTWDNGQL